MSAFISPLLDYACRPEVKRWVRANPAFYYVSYAVFLVTYIALACCPSVRRKYPGNYIALAVFVSYLEIYLFILSILYRAKKPARLAIRPDMEHRHEALGPRYDLICNIGHTLFSAKSSTSPASLSLAKRRVDKAPNN